MYNLTTYSKIISRIRQTAVSISSKIGHPYLIYRAFWHMKITPPICIILISSILLQYPIGAPE